MSKELEAIASLIRENNVSQRDIAAAYGCSASAISQFLSGSRPIPNLAVFITALSEVMGGVVTMEIELLARDGELKDYRVHVRHRIPEPDPEEQ